MIAIDIEAFDPNFSSMGDGSIRKDGAILCVGLYDGKDYVNCLPDDPRLVDWLSSTEEKIFHNSIYDLSWLVCGYNFIINGTLHDTMTRAALIDEYADLGLDDCCKRMKIGGKIHEDTIEAWFDSIKKEWDLRGNVWDNADICWMVPEGRKQMIKYNKQDCIATYNLFMAQEPYLKQQAEAYKLECDLQPVIMEMKRNGIRMDLIARDHFTYHVEKELNELEQQLNIAYGITRETVASPKKMTRAMNDMGIISPVPTATGGQSWSADALELIDHPAVSLIMDVKIRQALLNKYLHGSFVKAVIGDRLHCTFSPNKRDKGGTITGRFSSSKPNLQNIPARESKHGQASYGQEMRSLFIADEGCLLAACDYAQIEYLLLAHYAKGTQANWFQNQAISGVDFHTAAQGVTGISSRDQVKTLNYGIIYGMGVNKMFSINRKTFGTLEKAREIYNSYHTGLPVVRDTMTWCQNVAKAQGYIASIGGRLHHKPRPQLFNGRWNDMIYKMTNYLIQGSAAEILKRGLLNAWNAGVFRVLKLHITVHDENVASVPYTIEGTQALRELIYHMEQAYKETLLVPMKVACEVGPTWGYWNDDIWENMKRGKYDCNC